MTEPSLNELERDVEATRARLTRNLRTLRSPTARHAFTDALKHEAMAAKDDFVERTRTAAQSRIADWIDDLKARAAENPAAVLAIAAGIGWRLVRDPPIATALVGLGLFSLWRGNAPPRTGLSDRDYVDRAVENLKQQSSEVTSDMAERAGVAAAAAGGKMREWGEEVVASVRETGARAVDTGVAAAAAASNSLEAAWRTSEDAAARAAEDIGQAASDMRHRVREQSGRLARRMVEDASDGAARLGQRVENWGAEAAGAVQDGRARVTDEASAFADTAAERVQSASRHAGAIGASAAHRAGEAMADRAPASRSDTVNQLLLGAAGAAVAAALGVALQRRMSEMEPSN